MTSTSNHETSGKKRGKEQKVAKPMKSGGSNIGVELTP